MTISHRFTCSRCARSVFLSLLTVMLATSFITPVAQAQKFKVLYTFTGKDDGADPQAPLIRDAAGNLGDLGRGSQSHLDLGPHLPTRLGMEVAAGR